MTIDDFLDADNPPPKRKNGRPRLDPTDQTIRVTFTILEGQYDMLCAKAKRRQVTASALLRQVLARLS